MTWHYEQSSGSMFRNGVQYKGYSGNGRGKNNPAMQAAVGVGPIPRGRWKITGVKDSPNTGPLTLILDAVDAHPGDDRHDGTGRGAFRIHGDSIKNPGTASHGCIILPMLVRRAIWASGDRDLEVVA